MHQSSAVKCFFNLNPNIAECFETPDGVIHPLMAEAERWVKYHANKTIITYTKQEAKEAAEEAFESEETVSAEAKLQTKKRKK